jgi:hypothetical protein
MRVGGGGHRQIEARPAAEESVRYSRLSFPPPAGLQFAENLGNGHTSSHGSGTPNGMGQPPDGLTWLPVKVAMLPPLTMASGLTFSRQL